MYLCYEIDIQEITSQCVIIAILCGNFTKIGSRNRLYRPCGGMLLCWRFADFAPECAPLAVQAVVFVSVDQLLHGGIDHAVPFFARVEMMSMASSGAA